MISTFSLDSNPDLSTELVNYTVVTELTNFTIDVTRANLLTDTTVKDFVVVSLTNDVVLDNNDITKVSPTSLRYDGTPLADGEQLQVQRLTPTERYQFIRYRALFDSAVFNEEINRVWRRLTEATLYGIGPGSTISTAPVNQDYGPEWAADVYRSRVAKNLYEVIESLHSRLDDADNAISALSAAIAQREIKVGGYYLSEVATDPGVALGYGTWTLTAKGRALVGVDPETGGRNTPGVEFGEASRPVPLLKHTHSNTCGNASQTHAHTGTTGSSGTHTHNLGGTVHTPGTSYGHSAGGAFVFGGTATKTSSGGNHTHTFTSGTENRSHNHTVTIAETGVDNPELNVEQPSVTLYVWKRIA